MSPRLAPQRGAVLLLALLTVAMITALIGSVVWRQSSLIVLEAVERDRQQADWLMQGAMDWARLILREDGRSGGADHLSEPWAVPLKDTRLSGFLENTSEVGEAATRIAEQAWLTGAIEDAQGRFNLRNLLQGSTATIDPQTQAQLSRLLSLLGLPSSLASDLAQKMSQSIPPSAKWLPPRTADDLVAWGWTPDQVERIKPFVVVLPERTTLNINTASIEVLAACVESLSLSAAQQLVAQRERQPWMQMSEAQKAFEGKLDSNRHNINSNYFLIQGQLRLGHANLTKMALVKRDGQSVNYVWLRPLVNTQPP